jgi:hypothetical protein
MRSLEPRLSQFGRAFAWLLTKEVSADRLASLFGTTAGNIRVIAFRARHAPEDPASEEAILTEPSSPELATRLGIRPAKDEVIETLSVGSDINRLRHEIRQAAQEYAARYAFLDGIAALRGKLPQIGYAGDTRLIESAALLHQQIAWFSVHAGRTVTAAREAGIAREIWRIAYHESRSIECTEGFVQSALIGANAALLDRQPRRALAILDLAKQAAGAAGRPIGSEHFRQRGVALFQLREDEYATRNFERAAEAMEKLNEAQRPIQLLMTGRRHTNLLGPIEWDKALELASAARQSFGQVSLEAGMALHWAVACGFSTGSPSIEQLALDSLISAPETGSQFGHQVTIRKLLSVTPALGLDARLRAAWVRRALYENAFRSR